MQIVENAKQVWRHYSTIALGMAGSLQATWASLPEAVHSDLPPSVGKGVAWVTTMVALGGLAGKFIAQTPKEPDQPKDAP